MASLSLPESTIAAIIDSPSSLTPYLHPNTTAGGPGTGLLGLSPQGANFILTHGYTRGLHYLFILNACLAAVAVFASVGMIKQKNLTRDDDAQYKEKQKQAQLEKQNASGDLELGMTRK